MASPNARAAGLAASDLEKTQTYLNLPSHLRKLWLKKLKTFPVAWLQKPSSKERFESPQQCLERLNAYGFLEGCLFVTGRSRSDGTPNFQYLCKFHGEKTANKRKLEERVAKDEEGKIVTQRQRDTQVKKRGCPVEYFLSHKIINNTTKERAWIGIWKEDTHENHALHLNPFAFVAHEQSTEAHQQLIAQARKYRFGKQSYSKACELLKQEHLGLTLSQKTYYNLIRHKYPDKGDPDTLTGLLTALKDEDFKFRTRTEDEYKVQGETETLVRRKLLQIVFYHSEAIRLTQRFVAGHLLVIDGTFNTNRLRLPLLVAVGITNSNKSFPVAFSYCSGETAEVYGFFFECLRAEIFTNDIQDASVVLSDQAAGLISAVDTHDAIPHSQLQFCNWHAQQAILARFQKAGYTSTELDGYIDEAQVDYEGLKDLTWAYLKSNTLTELDANRQRLLDALRPAEQQYIMNTWIPKEQRVIFCYTRKLPNLGAASSQRVESYHPIIHSITHGQLSLEDSAKQLCAKLSDVYTGLSMDEDSAMMNRAIALDMNVFRHLVGSVSLPAIRYVEKEWLQLGQMKVANEELGPCDCDILLRYSLPCRHYLLTVYETGMPIPRSLLHPRWWLKGPTISARKWSPTYGEEQVLTLSPKRRDIHSALHEVLESRERLEGEERSRFDEQVLRVAHNLHSIAQKHEALAQIPIANPDPVPKKMWRRKKNAQNARGMTANELATTARKEAEKKEKIAKKDTAILQARATESATWKGKEKEIVLIPESDDEVTSGEEDKLLDIDDDIFTNLEDEQVPNPSQQRHQTPSPSFYALPPASTAPPALGRGKRQRAHTKRYEAGIEAGLINESQHGAIGRPEKTQKRRG